MAKQMKTPPQRGQGSVSNDPEEPAQKSIDRENAPIQDQYFIFVLIIGYTLNGYYFVLR